MSSPLKQNTTTIQELLDKINSLPEANDVENLDIELTTQSDLISEQDAKIAELALVLASKAGGGAKIETYTGTISFNPWVIGDKAFVWYTDASMTVQMIEMDNNHNSEAIEVVKNTMIATDTENHTMESSGTNIESLGYSYLPVSNGFTIKFI